MQYTEENNIPGLLLSVDFEKAFDSVSWSFIYKAMEFFGFGKSIISWIKTFNNNVKLSVNQCGNLSSFFSIGRGCRQGDPVSTFLFILCAEILGIMIRNNMNISGITINDKEHKLSQYACYVPGVTRNRFRKPKFSYLESQQKALLKFNKIY